MKCKDVKGLRFNPSLLGMGCMRFPTLSDGTIDKEQVKKMFKYALSHGVNYIDTAWPYHGGNSELVVGEIIKDYDRSSFYLATKLPMWAVDSREKALEIFNKQLEKLGTDYIDFYLLHALNKDRVEKIKEYKLIDLLVELKKQGKIRHIGFSFHDSYEVFEELMGMYDWEFCQLQINYMDDETQAGLRGVKLAEEKGTFVIVMEPLKGGALVNLSDEVKDIFKKENDDSLVKWAFRYVASIPNVKIILSGMSSFEQVKDNIDIFDDIKDLNKEEEKIIKEVKAKVLSLTNNNCTGCKYCVPCPKGVNIPLAFRYWNRYKMYGGNESFMRDYLDEAVNAYASQCVECGKCEKMCPQHISIRSDLKKVVQTFGK